MLPNRSGVRRILPGLGLLIALLIIGLCIYKDYGAGWDENAQRAIGAVNLQYITTGDERILDNFDRDHGAAFELPLIWAESMQKGIEFGHAVHMRHLISFLFYLAGIYCGYLLALRLFRKQWLALLGMGMLVLHPRIFAHAFFNSKDVPFLAALLIGLYLIYLAISARRGYLYLLAGLACGFATGIRNAGSLLVVLAGTIMLIDALERRDQLKKGMLHTLLFGTSAAAMLYLCWPLIWSDPITGFFDSIGSLSNYTQWDYSVLLNGVTYPAAEAPWYYALEWMLISTPVLWILLGISGFVLALRFLIKHPKQLLKSVRAKILLICAGLFLVPMISVLVLGSVLYDDWRHLYFIYPAFVMIALFGAERISRLPKMRVVLPVLIGVEVALTGFFMVRMHPFQNVYFNALVPHSPEYLRKHFDYEYWGTSNKQALEYLFSHEQRDSIPIVMTNYALLNNAAALPAEKRARLRWTDSTTPGSYFLTTYRFHPEDYPHQKIWSIQRGGSTVMQIYRIADHTR